MVWNAFFGFIFGTTLGSFVAATSYRLVKGKSLKGRSKCDSCGKSIIWFDLIPVISYLALKGKCRLCKSKISPTNFLVEVIMGLIVAWMFVLTPNDQLLSIHTLYNCFVVVVLAIVFLTDLKSGFIFDKVTYPAAVISLLYLVWNFIANQISPLPYLASGLISSIFFALLILITRGKGMGWGDVKLVLFMGLVLGFPKIITGLFLAFFIGSIVSLLLIITKQKKFGQTIPFGPFLTLGAFISLFWGDLLLNWYISIY